MSLGVLAGILLYAGYILGAFKIVEVVESWPDGRIWALLGFGWLMMHLGILAGAWAVIAGVA